MHDSPTPLRVLVVDPHTYVREGVKAVFGTYPDLKVVGEATDGPTALALAAELDPDVVVLEVVLSGPNRALVTARLREARPVMGVVVLSGSEQPADVRLLLSTGARGYVLKRSPAEGLVAAVRAVAGGGTYIDPAVAGAVVDSEPPTVVELSERETQVLRLLAWGYSNKEIAGKLALSVKTVETYKSRSMEKLNVCTRVGLVRYAVESGWLQAEAPEPSAPESALGE